jgi:hypothetical protein
MRFLIFLLLSTSAFVTQAATVTIDFDEVAPTSGMSPITVESKGYEFHATTSFGNPPDIGVSSNGIYAYGENSFGYCETCSATIIMERLDQGVFSVLALDSLGAGWFSGTLNGGSTVNLSLASLGTGDWLNLTQLVVYDANTFGDNYVHIDNIVVSAVPVPAAVWLFGSALVGLGWLRKKPII